MRGGCHLLDMDGDVEEMQDVVDDTGGPDQALRSALLTLRFVRAGISSTWMGWLRYPGPRAEQKGLWAKRIPPWRWTWSF